MSWSPQFGGKVRKRDLEKFEKLPNWKGGKFENLIETKMDITLLKLPKLLKDNFTDTKRRSPEKPLPIMPFDEVQYSATGEPKFVWYGHSVCLLQIAGLNLLIDPMLGPNASPIAPFKTKRFSENSLAVIDTLPKLDAVLLSHDHYDHIDYDSIVKLKSKTDTWLVALGVSRHLEKWGIGESQITEFDWWDELRVKDITIAFTPSRHFSGRGAFDRAKSLWGGFVFAASNYKVYWSGDGGYGPHFKEIGEKLGPFDWGFMECGQYNEHWHAIHLYPEESVRAALDAGVKVATPVHWGGFSLAPHSWKDPVERFWKAALNENMEVNTPKIGEIVTMKNPVENDLWWRSFS